MYLEILARLVRLSRRIVNDRKYHKVAIGIFRFLRGILFTAPPPPISFSRHSTSGDGEVNTISWPGAIEKNRAALMRIVARCFAGRVVRGEYRLDGATAHHALEPRPRHPHLGNNRLPPREAPSR